MKHLRLKGLLKWPGLYSFLSSSSSSISSSSLLGHSSIFG